MEYDMKNQFSVKIELVGICEILHVVIKGQTKTE